jgi:hypothetical protein
VLPLLHLPGLSGSISVRRVGALPRVGHGPVCGGEHQTRRRVARRAEAFDQLSLSDTDYVYVWGDGIHLKVCLEQVAR